MSIDSITAASAGTTGTTAVVGGLYSGTTTAAPTTGALDKQSFLNLLVTQLRNQDPTAPMDSNALMSQETQMASMQSLSDLSTTAQQAFTLQMRAAAAALVGKSVSYSDGTNTITGLVTAVSYAADVPTVTVGGKEIALDSVSAVANPTT